MYKAANPLSYAAKATDAELLKNVLKYTGAAGLFGLGTGSLASLIQHYRRPDINKDLDDSYHADITVPIRMKKKKPEFEQMNYKAASSVLQRITEKLRSGANSMLAPRTTLSGSTVDKFNTLLRDHPWAIPTAAVAIPTAGMLGYSAARSLGDRFKKDEDEKDLEEAKNEYEKALMGKLGSAKPATKSAGILSDILTNMTDSGKAMLSMAQNPTAAYAAFGIPAAAAGAYYGYSKYKDANRKAVEKALKRRAQIRAMESPPPIHVLPRRFEDDSDN